MSSTQQVLASGRARGGPRVRRLAGGGSRIRTLSPAEGEARLAMGRTIGEPRSSHRTQASGISAVSRAERSKGS
jgi:hypothetical protein